MSFLQVQNLEKSFGSFRAIDGVSLSVAKGEVCALLGPSGCGKTTTLRCIAGLESPDKGAILLDGRPLFDAGSNRAVAPEERGLGMVFQSYALWPNKSVADNLALGLRIKKLPKSEIQDRVVAGLALVGMESAASRYPGSLSGGQQQRVALARALVLQPKCILFDEPLSNLDLLLRERMRFEIRELLVRLSITAVYVTHDQSEAMVISDHVIVMNRGRIEREGPPSEVYNRPDNRFTAEFLGRTNVLAVDRTASTVRTQTVVTTNGLHLVSHDAERLSEAGPVVAAFRPEIVQFAPQAGAANRLTALVLSSQFLGAGTQVTLDLAGTPVTAVLPGDQPQQIGAEVAIAIDPRHVLLLRSEHE